MKFRYIILLLIIIVAGVLFFTNPSEAVVKNFIKDKFITIFNEKVGKEINQSEDPNIRLWGNLGKNLLPLAGDDLINDLIESRIRRKNYYLFSILQLNYKEQWNTIGIGILNKVFLLPKVEEEIQNFNIKNQIDKLLQ